MWRKMAFLRAPGDSSDPDQGSCENSIIGNIDFVESLEERLKAQWEFFNGNAAHNKFQNRSASKWTKNHTRIPAPGTCKICISQVVKHRLGWSGSSVYIDTHRHDRQVIYGSHFQLAQHLIWVRSRGSINRVKNPPCQSRLISRFKKCVVTPPVFT